MSEDEIKTVGRFTPESVSMARRRWDSLEDTARQVVGETARAMAFDREEYAERIDASVERTAQDVLFASELAVSVGSRAAFLEWEAAFSGPVHTAGSPDVGNVAWHAFDGEAVAATFENERAAAVATLRRQAFGRLYRDRLYDGTATGEAAER